MLLNHLLSCLLVLPVFGIGALCFIRDREMVNRVALVSTLLTLGLSVIILGQFDFAKAGVQFVWWYYWVYVVCHYTPSP